MDIHRAKRIANEFVKQHEDRFVRSREVVETNYQLFNKNLDKPGVVFTSAEIVEAHLVELLSRIG